MARTIPGQLDLFGDSSDAPAATSAPVPTPRSGYGAKADLVIEVLYEVHTGRYGRLDSTDRVVELDGEGHCRHAPDGLAEVVESLVAQRYAKIDSPTPVRHGVISKTVYPLKLTPGGRGLLTRSTMLRTRTPR